MSLIIHICLFLKWCTMQRNNNTFFAQYYSLCSHYYYSFSVRCPGIFHGRKGIVYSAVLSVKNIKSLRIKSQWKPYLVWTEPNSVTACCKNFLYTVCAYCMDSNEENAIKAVGNEVYRLSVNFVGLYSRYVLILHGWSEPQRRLG